MANPRPKLENLKSFARVSDRELGRVIGTRYPLDVEAALGKVDNHQAFIRMAVEEQLKRDGLLEPTAESEPEVEATPTPKRRSRTKPKTAQKKAQFSVGSRIKVPSGWTGYVTGFKGDRVLVTVGDGLEDDYPPHLLELV